MAGGNSEPNQNENDAPIPDVTFDGEPVNVDASSAIDTVFELLANRRRRFALYVMIDTAEGIVDRSLLVDRVTALEDKHRSAVPEDHRAEVSSDLRHWHVPVLADIGVVDYDERSEAIRYREWPLLETWLERVREDECR